MWPLEFLREPFEQRLAMALVHFLWQGLIVAGVYLAAIHLFAVRRPQARYVLSLVALAAMLACPVATLVVQCLRPAAVPVASTAPYARGQGTTAAPAEAPPVATDAWFDLGIDSSPDAPASADQPAARSFAAWLSILAGWLRAAQPSVVAAWALGVVILSARMCLGLATLAGLKRRGRPVSPPIDECVGRLCRRLGLGRMPRVLISDRVQEASAVGFFRPLVLLPAAWLAQLPPEVLEAVIAHELAHIRRWDLWANLFQRVVEALLFYHPAVWWLSRRVRTERELCCDELAVTATGQRVVYASALEMVARRRLARVRPALGAGISIGDRKMALLNRVRHVLGRVPAQRFAGWWPAGLVGLAVLVAAWMAASNWTAAVGAEDGDRAVRRDGDRPAAREGERRERDRERADRPAAREGERREGERAPIGPQDIGRLVQTINELRAQVDELRREVRELRAATGRERIQPGPAERERLENALRRENEVRQGVLRERLGAMERRVDELRKAGKMDEAEMVLRELKLNEARARIQELRAAGKADEAERVENELRQGMIRERLGAMERRVRELKEAGKMDAAEQAARELKAGEVMLRIEELRRAGKVDQAEQLEKEARGLLQKKEPGQKPAQARLEAMEQRVNELRKAGKMDAAEQALRELKLAAAKIRADELRAAGKVDEAERNEAELEWALQKQGGDKPARARLDAMERRVNELRKAGKMDAAEQAMRELKLAAAKVRAAELRAAGKVAEAEKIETEIKKALQKEGEAKEAKEFQKVKADLEKKKAEAEKARAEGEKKERAEKETAEKRERKEGEAKEKAEKQEKKEGEAKEKAEKKEKEGGDKEKAEKNEKEGGDKDKGDKENGDK